MIKADPRFKPPSQWKKRGQALRDLASLPPPDPMDGLEKILRPYQQVGTAWMLHLFDHGLGGILADEMGSGENIANPGFFVLPSQTRWCSKNILSHLPRILG